MSTTSAYMGFPISTINVDSGLNWETNLNSALTSVDAHNHSPGQGQQIQPNGLNITSDLTFQSNNAIAIRASRFTPQVSPIPNTGSDVGELYVSGNELFYNDATGGNQVQMTINGAVNATSSGISSGTATAAFSAGTLVVKSSSSSYGNVALQSVVLANSGNLVNQLTLQAPTLTSSKVLTLPATPGVLSFMTLDASGNMSGSVPTSGGLDTTNISSSAGILGSQLSPSAGIVSAQIAATTDISPSQNNTLSAGYSDNSGNTGAFSTSSTSLVTVVSNTPFANISSTRPVFICFDGAGNTAGSGQIGISGPVQNGANVVVTFFLYQQTGMTLTLVGQQTLSNTLFNVAGPSSFSPLYYPASSLNFVDFFPGSSKYVLQVRVSSPPFGSNTVTLDDIEMKVFQV